MPVSLQRRGRLLFGKFEQIPARRIARPFPVHQKGTKVVGEAPRLIRQIGEQCHAGGMPGGAIALALPGATDPGRVMNLVSVSKTDSAKDFLLLLSVGVLVGDLEAEGDVRFGKTDVLFLPIAFRSHRPESPDDAQINLSVAQFRITPERSLEKGLDYCCRGLRNWSLVSLPDDSMMVR